MNRLILIYLLLMSSCLFNLQAEPYNSLDFSLEETNDKRRINSSFAENTIGLSPVLATAFTKKWRGPFFFVELPSCTDTSVANISWEQEKSRLLESVKHINRLKPKFVFIPGNVTQAKLEEPSYIEQLADYKQIIGLIDSSIPVIYAFGSHEIGDKPTPETIEQASKEFNAHHFSFWVDGVFCVVLNTPLITDLSHAPYLYHEQLFWLEKELRIMDVAFPTHLFVFTHHPWFIKHFKEADSIDNITFDKRLMFLELLSDARCKVCFAGRLNQNAQGNYKGIELITTGAFNTSSQAAGGLRVVKVYDYGVFHHYYPLDQIPNKIYLSEDYEH